MNTVNKYFSTNKSNVRNKEHNLYNELDTHKGPKIHLLVISKKHFA